MTSRVFIILIAFLSVLRKPCSAAAPSISPTPSPSMIDSYESGIQLNSVTMSSLESKGCSVCMSSAYATATTTAMINACTGPYLFVGATSVYSPSTFSLGAFGSSAEVLKQTTLNSPHLSNGVYWYFTTGSSFGFLNGTDLTQSSADTGYTRPDCRLSWHVDQNVGGYRAGSSTGLNGDTYWSKYIYNCPGAYNSPSASPSISPIRSVVPTPYPNVTNSYESGIQLNSVTMSSLESKGCSVCMFGTYATVTTSAMINNCTGPYLFVGATSVYSPSTFSLGAFGSSAEVLKQTTLNSPHLSNGVYWYFTTGSSFGFLNGTDLTQYSADIGYTRPDCRLSWHVDQYVGGYRAGSSTGLNYSPYWSKYIYNCPASSSTSLSASPSIRGTTAPTVYTARPTTPPTRAPSRRPIAPTLVPSQYPVKQPASSFIPTAYPSVTNSYESGIQLNSVTMSSLESKGCSVCMSSTYSTATTTAMINNCTGPYLFVGATSVYSPSTFSLGAFGSSAEVLKQTTLNSPHLSNGVYWYFTTGSSFGFLNGTDLTQYSADTGYTRSDCRLSWHVDQNVGGYRAGSSTGLNDSPYWSKYIYNCPASSSTSLSASPSIRGTTAPTVYTARPTTPPTRAPSRRPIAPTLVPSQYPVKQPASSFIPTAYPSVTNSYKSGIQLNSVTMSSLESKGCSVCMSSTYATATTSAMINNCTGPYLFVGATSVYSPSTFSLGAFGSSAEVLKRTTLNSPHLSNGVYWYFTTGSSFGFLNGTDLAQSSADTGYTRPDCRLSWHVDQNVGGYRAGSSTGLNGDTSWLKHIYNCPGAYNSPSASPSISPIRSVVPTPYSSVTNSYKSGIQLNSVTMSSLKSKGCSVCMSSTYATATTSAMINNCTGPYLFVGATSVYSPSTFSLGAFGSSAEVLKQTTLNSPHLSNGVYWYFTTGSSFGFLNGTDLTQSYADTGYTRSDCRLSWHVDQYYGGYRAGSITGLNGDTSWLKHIYNCPASSPTASPSVRGSPSGITRGPTRIFSILDTYQTVSVTTTEATSEGFRMALTRTINFLLSTTVKVGKVSAQKVTVGTRNSTNERLLTEVTLLHYNVTLPLQLYADSTMTSLNNLIISGQFGYSLSSFLGHMGVTVSGMFTAVAGSVTASPTSSPRASSSLYRDVFKDMSVPLVAGIAVVSFIVFALFVFILIKLRKFYLELTRLRTEVVQLGEREELDRRERIESDRVAHEMFDRQAREQRRSDAITSPSMIIMNI